CPTPPPNAPTSPSCPTPSRRSRPSSTSAPPSGSRSRRSSPSPPPWCSTPPTRRWSPAPGRSATTTSSRRRRPGAACASAGAEGSAGQLVLVAQAPDGDDAGGVRGFGLDLGPQPLHVHVERLGVADVVDAPHPADEGVAG